MWLFVLFIAVPLIEIALFVQVGGLIGLWPTLAIVVITAFVGTWLMRAQGVLAINQLKNSLNELGDPTESLAHGAIILFAGALLLTPGFFTDAVGFSFLIPPVRTAVYRYMRTRMNVQSFSVGGNRQQRPGDDDTILDVDYEEVESPNHQKKPGDSGWTRH